MMTTRYKQSILFFLLFLWSATASLAQELPVAKPEAVGLSSERLQRLTNVFQAYADDKKMAGSVILIARHGKVAYFNAFGKKDIESGAAMQNDAIFRIASQSKALVSTAIMMLQEEGKLLIADPVSKYIPEFKETTVAEPKEGGGYNVVKAKRAITIRDLLTHTAGIGYGSGVAADKWKEAGIQGWYFADRDEPIAATIARLAALPMDAHPGEKYVYGYNTDILGVVVEKASGKPLDEFLTTRIFTPLGMKDTYFYLPENKTARLATVYSAFADKPMERAPDAGTMVSQGAYVKGPRKSFSGGAGLLSTATDYAKFLQMFLNGGVANGKRILSRKTVELMTVSHTAKINFRAGEGFGLGFSVCQDLGERGTPGSVGEYGWGGAYGSTYWVDPKEDLVVVYFKQLIPTNGLDDQAKLRALIYQAIAD
ncbi:beta-lactamase family protein [Fulvivirgaceae bacterium PWU4]|uniref:Beta-lactamase family protein n=1 Tax=Chryseosolibacter histidini TaxID=2782349 RepID=A0AAP2DJT1_9BACT|nr:serine hydrolase domain-containing protein [Chryseosolibacter histidini]MBT1696814.1 beta-lactamase family protein [Chryseosolibacter histidini]